jgi:hypothetical protein
MFGTLTTLINFGHGVVFQNEDLNPIFLPRSKTKQTLQFKRWFKMISKR